MALPLASILYLLSASVTFYFSWLLARSYKRIKNIYSYYVHKMALFGAICLTIFGLMCIFFTKNSFALGLGNIIGEASILICYLYASAFFFHLAFFKIAQKKVFYVGGVLIVLATIFRIIFFPYPVVNEAGILIFNTPLISACIYSALAIGGVFPLVFVFFREAIRNSNVRVRSTLLGFFLLLIIATTVIPPMTQNPLLYTLGFFVQMASFSLLFLTILYHPVEKS